MQAPQPPQMQPQAGAPQPQQQQQQMVMPAPAPNAPIVQHTQYAPQQQHQMQNTNYQPQQQQHQAPAPPPGQAPQGQHFPHQGLNGGWQSDQDYNERRKMIAKIVHLLKQRKPNAPQDWLKKLPQMAKRLEESLYRSAKSFEEYNDASTLKQRLQQLAHNIGMKTKRMQQAQMAQRTGQPPLPPQQQQQQQQQQAPSHHGQTPQPQYLPPQAQQQPQPQHQHQPQQQPIAPHQHHQQQPVQPRPPPQQNYQPVPQQQQPMQHHQHQQQPMQQPHMPQQHQQGGQQRIVNVAEINPIMGGQMVQPSQAPAPVQPAPMQQQQYQYQPQPAPAPQAQPPPQMLAPPPAGSTSPQNGARRQVSDRQQVLRHQQQRLLLLRHAAKCQHEDGRCPVTPHCAGMKRLWKHIAECKDQKCLVPHCVSSRYVLSHYHRCKDVRCPVCGPVREAIHRSHEKQKQMQALKQQHQRAVEQSQSQPAPNQALPQQQPLPPQQAVQPLPSIPAPIQPPPKRQRTSPNMVASQPPYQAQSLPPQPGQPMGQPPLHQPPPPPAPGQPQQPGAPGYAYPQPGVKPAIAGSAPVPVQAAPGVAFQNGQMITPKYTGPKPQEDHTLINCFSIDQIETHIASLNNGLQLAPLKLKTTCLDVLKVLQSHQHGWVFNSPVDPVELGLPDYFEVIKKPMDLGTIRKKLENGVYHSLEDFEAHVHLTFDNAMLYNPEGSVVYNMAKEMKDKFSADYEVMMKQLLIEEDQKRKNGEACLLCGCEKLQFEPPVFYCNGLNCPSKRIRRNSYYYVGGNNQYHWCHMCFQDLKDNKPLELGDMTIRKEQLTKKKNDEVHEESWVQCDRCERWIHQICALFNTRQNKDQRSEYACPRCTIAERKKKGQREGISSTPMAEDLQRTKLSEYLENHVRVKMKEHLDEEAKRKSIAEGIPLEDAAKQVEMGGAITIRQVTSMDKKLEVRERMKKRYAFKNYPDEFSYRCKCIVVFQNLDGVDVILFGLYVYEHDESNPAPNRRTVYVSYLDSVHYMRPRNMRTFIYHEILISYLDYVRRRGYSTAHIWACPPLKGDDYILYAKPEDQKTPKDDRLKQWYIDMLVECQRRGVVGTVTNMYDLYFSSKVNDATVVPYMDGDYFPAEVENIIKDIEEGKTGKKGNTQGKKKKNDKSKQKKKSGRGGTRSTGIDEEALKASGILTPGKDQKSLEKGGRDYVMVKLGETIQPMKESFIVAFLAWEGARDQDMVVPKEIQEYREKNGMEVYQYAKKESIEPEESKSTETPKAEQAKPDESASAEQKPDDSKPEESGEPKIETAPTEESKKEESSAEESKKDDIKVEGASDGGEKPSENSDEPKPTEDAEMKDIGPAELKAESSGKDEGGSKPEEKEENRTENGSATAPAPSSDAEPKPMDVDKKDEGSSPEQAEEKKDESPPEASTTATEPSGSPIVTDGPASAASTSAPAEEHTAAAPVPAEAPSSDKEPVKVLPMVERAGKFAAMARKRGRDDVDDAPAKEDNEEAKEKEGEPKEDETKEEEAIYVTDSKGRRVKVVDDDAEEMDCEFLNNRQAFLNLCQGNHYQFDHLRRAKHSSMMVLWHLHNRDAPKFVQQCTTCSREILSGYRFHCPTCADFDQCQECVQNPNTIRHPHQLKPIPVSGQQTELTEAQRKERQRSIQLHMTLLLHAATCTSAKCPSANCTKMKGLLKHGAQCQQKATGGCNVCKRIWALLQIHARQCKATSCPVPNCMAIRERVRQLKKQQQAMDDRRRQEMNRVYRGAR